MARMQKIILYWGPAGSPYHLPMGIAYLAGILEATDCEVIQRYAHITALEWLLGREAPETTERAFAIMRQRSEAGKDRQAASQFLQAASHMVAAKKPGETFEVVRNNVRYVARNYDGSIDGLMHTIREPQNNLWYDYLTRVELPFVAAEQPGLLAISIADERQFVASCLFAALVKKHYPATKVMLGGNFFSRVVDPKRFPDFAQIFLTEICDVIVYSEGFEAIRLLATGVEMSRVPGAIWLDSQGSVRLNPPAGVAFDFEQIPTPVFNRAVRQWAPEPVYPLYTMSNCPMKCDFCAISKGSDSFLGKTRAMSPHRIAEHIVRLGATAIDFQDELLSVARQLAIGNELHKLEHAAIWNCYLTVTKDLVDPEVCHQLYQAGCRGVQVGLESLSITTLAGAHKGWNDPAQYGRILQNLREAGIQVHGFIIVGIPGEPISEGVRWLEFIDRYGGYLTTLKPSRYQLARGAPDYTKRAHRQWIEVVDNVSRPLRLNEAFRYRHRDDGGSPQKDVEALLVTIEDACRRHPLYNATSCTQWWANRRHYTWDELQRMSQMLESESPASKLPWALGRTQPYLAQSLTPC